MYKGQSLSLLTLKQFAKRASRKRFRDQCDCPSKVTAYPVDACVWCGGGGGVQQRFPRLNSTVPGHTLGEASKVACGRYLQDLHD